MESKALHKSNPLLLLASWFCVFLLTTRQNVTKNIPQHRDLLKATPKKCVFILTKTCDFALPVCCIRQQLLHRQYGLLTHHSFFQEQYYCWSHYNPLYTVWGNARCARCNKAMNLEQEHECTNRWARVSTHWLLTSETFYCRNSRKLLDRSPWKSMCELPPVSSAPVPHFLFNSASHQCLHTPTLFNPQCGHWQ